MPGRRLTPLSAMVLFGAVIVVAEVLVTAGLGLISPTGSWTMSLVDAAMTTLLALPALYLLTYRPMSQAMTAIKRVEAALLESNQELEQHVQARTAQLQEQKKLLEEAQTELELRVQERTRELQVANQELAEEIDQRRKVELELRSLSRAEQQARRLAETLSDASMALSRSLNLEIVMATLLDTLATLVPFDAAGIFLLNEDNQLVARAARGYEPRAEREAVIGLKIDLAAYPGLQAQIDAHQSVLIADTFTIPGWADFPGTASLRSYLGIPLVAGGRVIGLYSLGRNEPGALTEEHLHLAGMMVSQAAVAIQNAWLFEQVQDAGKQLQSLSRRLVQAQENERRAIARELHDEAGQSLTTLMIGLDLLEHDSGDPEAVRAGLARLRQMTEGVSEELHRLAMDLRPATLDHLGLVPALRQAAESISRQSGLRVEFEAVGIDFRLPSDLETALYRIVQEAVTNAVRHAHATSIDILLERRNDRLVVMVEDDGVGFKPMNDQPGGVSLHSSMGLVGMRERAESFAGQLVIESAPGQGTTLLVEVPLPQVQASNLQQEDPK